MYGLAPPKDRVPPRPAGREVVDLGIVLAKPSLGVMASVHERRGKAPQVVGLGPPEIPPEERRRDKKRRDRSQ